MALGGPILVWVYLSDGVIWGLVFTLAMLSVFRWPLRHFIAWLLRAVSRRAE